MNMMTPPSSKGITDKPAMASGNLNLNDKDIHLAMRALQAAQSQEVAFDMALSDRPDPDRLAKMSKVFLESATDILDGSRPDDRLLKVQCVATAKTLENAGQVSALPGPEQEKVVRQIGRTLNSCVQNFQRKGLDQAYQNHFMNASIAANYVESDLKSRNANEKEQAATKVKRRERNSEMSL